MSITDELREYARIHQPYKSELYNAQCADEITAIADRIDVEHERRMVERADRYSELRAKMNNCYIELPKDADGECIHVGDVMEWVRYKDGDPTIVRTVSGIGNGVFFAWSDEQGRYAQYKADAYRHYHAPTVEDVLEEFGIDWEHESDCEDRAALLKEYAAKLRLAEGEDA